MDITATQAEAQTKATAWLAQNLPVETPPAVVPAAAAPVAPAPVVPAEAPKVAPAAPVVTPPAKPGLTEAIRRDREARAGASTAATEAAKYKGELEAARKENEALRAAGAATDPFDFLRARKLSKDQQALWGQAFLYDLKPEVAPQEFRLELYKAEQARKEAEKAEADRKSQAEQAQRAQADQLNRYADELMQHVQSSAGSNPESETWFSEDGADGQSSLNHLAYAQSLLATADNLAKRAQQSGQQADLSPANVARVLEAEVSKRMQRRDAKRAGKATTEQRAAVPAVPAQGGAQATTTTTTSAVGLRSGAPLPPAQTEEERRARAAAVLFGTK